MSRTRLAVAACCVVACGSLDAFAADAPTRSKQAIIEAWQRDRFGIFVHWGPSSVLDQGSGSWARKSNQGPQENQTRASPPDVITSGEYLKFKGRQPVPQDVYDNLFHVFNPTNFDAREWAKLFKEAGAGYVVFTAKHHDGFCMFETRTQDYNIMKSPFRRDICRELVDACRAAGVRVFWYYSPVDWWNPKWISKQDTSYEETHFLPQVEELLANYGPVDGIWWDGGQITKNYVKRTFEIINKHQPWIMTNGRLGDGAGGDFGTPEQALGEFNMEKRWESCITMTGDSWFWNGGKNYKSATTCIRTLIQCACGDGNLLLDVGPRPDGRIDERAAATYRAMGRWLNEYGQSVRGTRGGPYKPGLWGGSTRNGKHVYLHITEILEDGELTLPVLPAKIVSARCLTGGDVTAKQTDSVLKISLTKQSPVESLVDLELDSNSMGIKPIETSKANAHSLSENATGSSSSIGGMNNNASCLVPHAWEKNGATLHFGEPGYEEQQTALAKKPEPKEGFGWANNHLGHPFRYWQAKESDTQPWIELELAAPKTFTQVCLLENYGYTEAFAFDAFVNGEWKTNFTDGEMGIYNRKLRAPVTTAKVRIRFLKTTGPVSMTSVMLY